MREDAKIKITTILSMYRIPRFLSLMKMKGTTETSIFFILLSDLNCELLSDLNCEGGSAACVAFLAQF